MDFSKPVNSSTNNIDISADNITIAIHLPDIIPRLSNGALFISDGVMHMLPGEYSVSRTPSADDNRLGISGNDLPSMVSNFNLTSREWVIEVSKIEDNILSAAIAFDAEKQVGWYCGGMSLHGITSHALYRLDKGKGAPTKVGVYPSVWDVVGGELVYIQDVGKAGILVLIGGLEIDSGVGVVVGIRDTINNPPAFWLMLFYSGG